jgi:hypothetical protein
MQLTTRTCSNSQKNINRFCVLFTAVVSPMVDGMEKSENFVVVVVVDDDDDGRYATPDFSSDNQQTITTTQSPWLVRNAFTIRRGHTD